MLFNVTILLIFMVNNIFIHDYKIEIISLVFKVNFNGIIKTYTMLQTEIFDCYFNIKRVFIIIPNLRISKTLLFKK